MDLIDCESDLPQIENPQNRKGAIPFAAQFCNLPDDEITGVGLDFVGALLPGAPLRDGSKEFGPLEAQIALVHRHRFGTLPLAVDKLEFADKPGLIPVDNLPGSNRAGKEDQTSLLDKAPRQLRLKGNLFERCFQTEP